MNALQETIVAQRNISLKHKPSRLFFILFPGVEMLLGWGLRGFIGGGPYGAMIPGAMVMVAICMLLDVPLFFAAIAVVFGTAGTAMVNSEYNQVRNELNGIRRRIKDAEANQENPIVEELRKRKEKLDKDIVRIEETIDSLNREIGEFTNEKTQKNKRIEELSRKLSVSEKNKEKDAVITRNINNLKNFIAKFKAQKKTSLEAQILKGLDTLMHKKGFIKKVEVEIIGEDIDIILKNANGDEIKKESLSKGEQQMYATALLRGLVEESNIQFPVFIDSPMQKFDEQHAENIVKYFYPNISDQVIIFPLINKEMTEKEYKLISKNIAQTYLINNIHNEKSEFKEIDPKKFFSTYNQLYNNAN